MEGVFIIGNLIDLRGMRFGRLLVLCRDFDNTEKHAAWVCKCDCGATVSVIGTNLRRGTSKSCGCLQKELLSQRKTTHGGWAKNEALYSVWCGILSRCNPKLKNESTKNYGQRGIRVCPEWENYQNFREWAKRSGYTKGLSIDRIDVDGDYCPDNCRWTDSKTQQNNRRSNIRIEYCGETRTLKEWSEILNINYQTVYSRYSRGLPIELVLKTTSLK